MTISDMDISLNVTADPVFSARTNKQRRTESLKTSIKRLKNQSLGKKGIAVNNESKNVNTQKIESKKRIRQKSLSTIFAKKLKEANAVNQNAQSQIVPRVKDITAKAQPESGKIKQSDKSNKVLSIANSDITNKQTVSFTKITKQHIGETLLAKKRNISIEQKKSLSNIFSGRLKNESNKIELNVSHDIDKDSKLNKKSEIVTEESPTLKVTERINILNKRDEKKRKGKIVNNNRKSDKTPKLMHKAGGKISSLFGNNPDVPTIGQRLVKPVDEPVFTKITFADLNIHPYMISNLEQNMHITKMTTVQQKAIPEIFSARDVLIRSQTGSGKTLAYALPIVELLHKIKPKLNRNSGLLALVVVPTRELALQTYECFIKLVKPFTWIVPGYVVGGEKRKAEKARLRKGCNILITTPGRLLDHIKHTKALRLNEVRYFVLDEADRMLDMGYEKDISEIVSALTVSSSNKAESGYDAMKILKQNIKDTSTDKKISKEDDIKSCNKIEDHIDSNKVKRTYHSSDDSEDDNQDIIKEKKVSLKERKKDTKYLSMNQGSDSKSENAQKIERDCKDVNQSRRQTILLSATLTQAVEKLAGLAMHNPIFVDAAKENLEMSGGDTSEINEDLIVPQGVIQSYIVTPPKLRMVTLSAYIASRCQTPGQHKIVIFMATQDMVDYHTEILSSVLTKPVDDDDEDFDSLVDVEFFKLHGNMTQKERTEVFKTFSQAKSGVLLCTDVAARGLDMPKVDCVVQYTGPISARDYVHRIGRTARAGCSGVATIFLTPPEIEFVRMLESRRIRIKQQDMNDVLDKLLGPLSQHNSVQAAAVALQNDFENLVLEDKQLGAKACKAYISWMRFYSSYPRDMREIFNRKELHLGHYAKSFALRDPPQRIGGISKKLREKESLKPKHNNRLHKPSDGVPQKEQKKQNGDGQRTGLLKRARMLNTSEYDSGLGFLKKPKK
ncbi:probable ATP-dependent RNA helicase CG8611 [Formica exsecta]|uniref:probable ATP-dependent RNA helicase CG8611 n=1 Tax=Formica exsecta TaxID=72781 RepID=UPI001144B898|nr:probable ATP-dependent RNA helicase CG8611 [Formica exsecta]